MRLTSLWRNIVRLSGLTLMSTHSTTASALHARSTEEQLTCRYSKVQDRKWCLIRIEAFVHLVDSPRYRLEIARPAVDVVELSVGTRSSLTPCSRRDQSADLDLLVPRLISPQLTAIQLTAR